MYAVSHGAQLIEKHFTNNKSLQVDTQLAHVCSMDLDDLTELRNFSDAFTLIRNANK